MEWYYFLRLLFFMSVLTVISVIISILIKYGFDPLFLIILFPTFYYIINRNEFFPTDRVGLLLTTKYKNIEVYSSPFKPDSFEFILFSTGSDVLVNGKTFKIENLYLSKEDYTKLLLQYPDLSSIIDTSSGRYYKDTFFNNLFGR